MADNKNKDSAPGPERRKFARIKLSMQIQFRSFIQFEDMLDGCIKDLSIGGMFMGAKQVKPVGTKVEIELPDPYPQGGNIKIGATVRSVREKEGVPIGMGIEFDDLSPRAKQLIEYLLEKHKEES